MPLQRTRSPACNGDINECSEKTGLGQRRPFFNFKKVGPDLILQITLVDFLGCMPLEKPSLY